MPDQILAGERIAVTGANRGIGWAVCQTLAANGAHLVVTSRGDDPELGPRWQTLATEHTVQVQHIPLELTDSGSIKDFVSDVRKLETPLTGLVNNAGVTYNALFQMSPTAKTREVFEVNVFGLIDVMQACARLMARHKRGSIVNISSTAAMDGNPGRSIYGAAKASLVTLTRAAARELAPLGIRVNAVAPGLTHTDMLESMTDEVIAEVEAATDLRRRGEPGEIAEAVSFLMSPLASYVTGQTLRVDGGLRA